MIVMVVVGVRNVSALVFVIVGALEWSVIIPMVVLVGEVMVSLVRAPTGWTSVSL